MKDHIVSAVFDDYSEAKRAVRELRDAGVRNDAFSVIGRDEGRTTTGEDIDIVDEDDAGGAAKGALAGAGIGAILGVAALAIPGVGPLAAAGAIASGVIPGAAAIGAGAGAVAGGLTGLLTEHGVSDEDAAYYEEHINRGGIFVSVDTSDGAISPAAARDILYDAGGHSSSRARVATEY
jgi:hypothetical protein